MVPCVWLRSKPETEEVCKHFSNTEPRIGYWPGWIVIEYLVDDGYIEIDTSSRHLTAYRTNIDVHTSSKDTC